MIESAEINVMSKLHLKWTDPIHTEESVPMYKGYEPRERKFIRKCWRNSRLLMDAEQRKQDPPDLPPCRQKIAFCYGQGCRHQLYCEAVPDWVKRKVVLVRLKLR